MFACIEDKWNNKQQEYISKVRQNVPEELMFLHLDGEISQRIKPHCRFYTTMFDTRWNPVF